MSMLNEVGRRKTRSLAVILALALVALSVTILLVASGAQLFFNFQTQRQLVADQQQLIAREAANTVAGFVEERFGELDAAAKVGLRGSASPEERKSVLDNLLGLDIAFRQVALLDLQGQELASASRLSQLATGQLSERLGSDALAQVRQGNRQISPVYIDDVTSEPLVIMTVPVTDIFGDPQSMLLAEINLKFMWDLVDRLQVGETGVAYVVNSQGDLLAFSDVSRVLRGENVKNLSQVSEFISNPDGTDETEADTFKGITGATVTGTYAPLGTPDWAVVIELPIAEAYREVVRGGVIGLIVILVMAILAGLIGAYIARRLAAPLLGLTETATRIASGEMGLRATTMGPSEVVSLAQAFNQMNEQVGTLLETVQARSAELEERGRELEASQRVTFAASERATPDEMLDLVVNLIRDQFDLYHAQVYMVDEAQQVAVLRQSTGYAGRQLLQRKHRIPLEATSLVTRAIHTGEPVLVDDVQADPNFLANPLLPDTRSELVVPLKRENQVIGVLDAQDRTAGRFNPGTIALFQTMTDQVAILFENSELLQRVTDQTEVLSVFTTQLRTAADIARRLGTILDSEQLLQEVVELIQSRFGLYHAHIYLLDAETNVLKLSTGSGEVGRVLRERGHSIPMDAEKSLVARAARAGSTVLVADTALEADFMPNPLLPQTRSELSLPLVVGNTPLGVLDLQDDQAGRFTEAERDTFGTLAGLIATAIQNARLFERQRESERAIQQSEAQQRLILESTPTPTLVTTVDGRILYANPQVGELFGMPLEDFMQRGVASLYYNPADRQEFLRVMEQEGRARNFEIRFKKADGSSIWTLLNTEPITYAGEPAMLNGIYDITERRQAEERVRIFQSLAENAADGITMVDFEGKIFYANRAAYDILGFDFEQQDLMGASLAALADESEREVQAQAIQHIMTEGGSWSGEGQARRKDGSPFDIAVAMFAVLNTAGRPISLAAIFRDVTEGKRAQVALQESEQRLSEALNIAQMGYWTLDIATNTFTFNDQYYKAILNTTAEEVGGYALAAEEFAQRFVVPEDAPLVAENARLAIESPDPDFQIQFESRNLTADGEEVWTTIWTTAERDAEGRTIGMRGVSQVITERKQAEAEIEKRASELQTVAEVSTAASTILEPDRLLGRVVELTKANFGLYHAHIYLIDEADESLVLAAGAGEAGQQMLAQGWQIAVDSATSLVARAFRTRQGVIANDVRAAPDFLPNPLLPDTRSELAVPLIVGEQVLGVLDVQSDQVGHFTQQDVTIQTTLAGQIATAVENARLFQETRQVDRLKSEFLANMSHELRTPLNSIIGYVQLLLMDLEGEIPEDSYEDMKSVETNSQHLLNLINDVLDLARIEAGRMELHMEHIDLPNLLDIVKSNNAGLFIDSPLTFSVEAEPDLPQIYADQIRITQVLNNLISNAFKFTETGGIIMRAYSVDDEICIAIEDTGIGIAEKDLDMVFERFRQVDGSFTRRAEGTGLGLSITRLLVELHGGRLTVQSKLGEGSTFIVHLPVAD
ncbi:MAG: MEKHLA domain-containing protein [Anaerolineae bacterium]|nr:MEKHLA domain-containing protein [Anaerolineae bacterium]